MREVLESTNVAGRASDSGPEARPGVMPGRAGGSALTARPAGANTPDGPTIWPAPPRSAAAEERWTCMTNESAPANRDPPPPGAASSRPPLPPGGAATLAFPTVIRAQAPIKWRVRPPGTPGSGLYGVPEILRERQDLVGGKARVPASSGGRGGQDLRDVRCREGGVLDAMHVFTIYWASRMPVTAFLSSYPWRWTGRTSGRHGSTSSADSRSRGRRTRPRISSTWA